MGEEILKRGLTSTQANQLLKQYDINEINVSNNRTARKVFLAQFNNILMVLLVFAAGISFTFGKLVDALFIGVIVLLNALFGFYQEFKAEESLLALKNITVSKVRVVRDGYEQEIDSKFLVPGDIIHLEEGAKIPADAVLIEAWNFEVDESSLTGESFSISKDVGRGEKGFIYLGTTVVAGRAIGKVEKTGLNTRFGQIASTLSNIQRVPTPLQRKLRSFSHIIGLFGIVISIIVMFISYLKTGSFLNSFLYGVSLAVAAVPEGLPAVLTITLAIGVKRMAARHVIIRRLESIEGLGAITLIATDKTGTITANTMSVKKIYINGRSHKADHPPSFANSTFRLLLTNGILCSSASLVLKVDHGDEYDILGDPTEGALLLLARNVGVYYEDVRKRWEKKGEVPFNSETKQMSVKAKNQNGLYVFTKGSPESILAACNKILINDKYEDFTQEKKGEIERAYQQDAGAGLRLIAFSFNQQVTTKKIDDTVFLGFVGIADPVRPEIKEAIKKAFSAGIQVVMVTGDNALTAEAIGIEVGLIKKGDDIIDGEQITSFADADLLELLPKTKIFARISPEQKFRLIKLYQQLGHIVAVTGDGVNDALALKQADIGVAVGRTGSDVAREASDMVIVDNNFASLIGAVEEGRNIFINLKKAISYLLATNLAEVIVVIITLFAASEVALTAIQILYINLVSDGLPALSLAFSPTSPTTMRNKPTMTTSLLSKTDILFILQVGVVGSVLTLTAFFVGQMTGDFASGRTMAFTTVLFIQPLIALYLWSRHSLSQGLALLKKPVFAAAFFVPFLFHLPLLYSPFLNSFFHLTPLSPPLFLFATLLSLLILLPLEIRRLKN